MEGCIHHKHYIHTTVHHKHPPVLKRVKSSLLTVITALIYGLVLHVLSATATNFDKYSM